MSTPGSGPQAPSFRRPSSAVGPLGIGALLVVVGVLSQYLPIPSFELAFVLSLAVPVGVVVIVVALRRMALGLEAVYDRLEAEQQG